MNVLTYFWCSKDLKIPTKLEIILRPCLVFLNMLKISIITVCYNSALTIRDTIDSVLSQDFMNIEYIIVDGLSSDGTQDLVKSFGSRISKFISEKDNGLYDAMNKGVSMATGDIIGILNSDDIYSTNQIISLVANKFENENSDCVFGDLVYFQSKDPKKIVRKYSGRNFSRQKIRIGILPPHPTFFVKRNVYEQFGNFDLQFKYASDFDLMARLFYVHNISYSYLPIVMVNMRLGGISTGSFKRIIEINKEDLRSCKKNKIPTNFLLFHIKYVLKILSLRSVSGIINR